MWIHRYFTVFFTRHLRDWLQSRLIPKWQKCVRASRARAARLPLRLSLLGSCRSRNIPDLLCCSLDVNKRQSVFVFLFFYNCGCCFDAAFFCGEVFSLRQQIRPSCSELKMDLVTAQSRLVESVRIYSTCEGSLSLGKLQ